MNVLVFLLLVFTKYKFGKTNITFSFPAIALQKKWKNIRDCYRRECAKKKTEKSGSGATAVRKEYIFFSQLSFLSANNDIKPSQSNDDMEEEEDFEKGRCDARKDLPKPSAKKKRASAEDSLINALSTKINKQLDEPKDDADRNFLMSLLPHLKFVSDSSKLDCQCELMQVVKRYKAPSITHPYQVPYPINYQASQSFHGHGNFGVQSAQSGEFATPAVSPVGSASVDSNDTIFEELF